MIPPPRFHPNFEPLTFSVAMSLRSFGVGGHAGVEREDSGMERDFADAAKRLTGWSS